MIIEEEVPQEQPCGNMETHDVHEEAPQEHFQEQPLPVVQIPQALGDVMEYYSSFPGGHSSGAPTDSSLVGSKRIIFG